MIKRAMRFWSEERSLSVFLAFLATQRFVLGPMIRAGLLLDLASDLLFSLLLLAGLLTIVNHRVLRVICGMVVVLAIVVRWTGFVAGTAAAQVWAGMGDLLASACFLLIVLWQVYREGPITRHRILGAIAGYLLLALSFSYSYGLIEHLIPGSFAVPSTGLQVNERHLDSFLYFSVVTLTTVGFGDVLAIHPFARSLVMLEAVIGALYPAVLIARLVSLQVEARQHKEKKKMEKVNHVRGADHD
jgi:hypothetical protein